MTSSNIQQYVSGINSNVGFFFGGWSNGNLIMVEVGWFAQGNDPSGILQNGIVTNIDVGNQTITIQSPKQFISGRSYYFTSVPLNYNAPCVKEDTKILCLKENKEQYIPIQNIRKGDLVKTNSGFKKVDLIGQSYIHNPDDTSRTTQRLFKCSKENFDMLFEDLFITGGHSILVDSLTEQQQQIIKRFNIETQLINDKYSLLTFINVDAKPYTVSGIFAVYHIALEHTNPKMNYGIFANGLLVESCSYSYMVASNMTII